MVFVYTGGTLLSIVCGVIVVTPVIALGWPVFRFLGVLGGLSYLNPNILCSSSRVSVFLGV